MMALCTVQSMAWSDVVAFLGALGIVFGTPALIVWRISRAK